MPYPTENTMASSIIRGQVGDVPTQTHGTSYAEKLETLHHDSLNLFFRDMRNMQAEVNRLREQLMHRDQAVAAQASTINKMYQVLRKLHDYWTHDEELDAAILQHVWVADEDDE